MKPIIAVFYAGTQTRSALGYCHRGTVQQASLPQEGALQLCSPPLGSKAG